MYINPYNREMDEAKLLSFVRLHPFGLLVTARENVPAATHVPFLVAGEDGRTLLRTHLSRANRQWKGLDGQTDALVVFNGPHAYISPRWYDHVNVPTMNYVAVHAYGKPRLIEDPDAVYALLKSQIEQFETDPEAYNIGTLPGKFLADEMRGLVALEIAVDRWEGNFKLSQNRDEKNYRNIVAELGKTGNPTGITEAMQRVYEAQGYKH
ncbi:MAG: FMN-binding negative transcriptional regulator [Cytophagales bacterium]|nr:FMN-binding negative transcriptional regulator [Cytophagales bacterium]